MTQQVSDTVVLLNLDNGEYYALDEVGTRVWELCDGAHSVSDVVSTICQEYDAPAETVETDVLELIEDLIREKLVVEATEAAGGSAATAEPE